MRVRYCSYIKSFLFRNQSQLSLLTNWLLILFLIYLCISELKIASSNYTGAFKKSPSFGELPHGKFLKKYSLLGSVFSANSSNVKKLSTNVSLSLIYSFYENEEHFKQSFYDHHNEIIYKGLGPAILEQDDGTMLSVQRMWLAQYDLEFHAKKKIETKNSWQENYAFKRLFDSSWNPVERGHLLGIPAPANCRYAYRSDGPMDPRLFRWNDTIFMSMHIWLSDEEPAAHGRMFMWNYNESRIIKLKVPKTFLSRLQGAEINWIPLVDKNKLYVIYSFDPLRVFQCNIDGKCFYAHWPEGEQQIPFKGPKNTLRGGSPFILYDWPYYISVGHSQLTTQTGMHLYGANLIVVSVHPKFRVVYVSSPLKFDERILLSSNITRQFAILRPFVFPVGNILRTLDIIDIGAHMNDAHGHIFRLSGLSQLMKNVVKTDQTLNTGSVSGEDLRFQHINSVVGSELAEFYNLQPRDVFIPKGNKMNQ